MIINTYSKKTIENSIREYFQTTQETLYSFFDEIYHSSTEAEHSISHFVSENIVTTLENIKFYHLSRRLNGSDLTVGNNLYDVLLKPTTVSFFLRKHGIEFKMGPGHLLLYHNGKLEELRQAPNGNLAYVKWRMGYDKDDEDYCFNGFAFRDLLTYNDYYRSYEFAQNLYISWQRFLIEKK